MRLIASTPALSGRLAGIAVTAGCTVALTAGSASAAGPTLRIATPTAGSYTHETSPAIIGTLEPDEGLWCEVTVKIYSGTVAEGPPLGQTDLPGSETCTNWQALPESPLTSGKEYTIVAEETFSNEEEKEVTIKSAPVTFTVDNTPPVPTISSPAGGATYFTGAIPVSGRAGVAQGDRSSVILDVFSGSDLGSAPIESVEAAAPGGAWSATLAGLTPGAYTLQAQQADAAGNVGASARVPITVLAPPPAPPPSASFTWFPEQPRVGETVTLISSATDTSSPITSLAWGLTATEPFHPGRATMTTTFGTAGAHAVRLQVTDAAGRSATSTQTILVHHAAPTLMEPFPLVRLAGRETSNGVKLTLVQVTAPVSARVTVRIRGTGVRSSSQSRIAAATRPSSNPGTAVLSFPRFARALAAGAVLEIRVTKAGQVGKLTRFVPRRGKLPRRTDSCLSTGEKPIVCPAS